MTIRVTEREKARLLEQANIAGLSLSEYMRRRFLSGKTATYTDIKTVGELRRIGGLLKQNFVILRQANMPRDLVEKQEETLRKLVRMIDRIGLALDERRRNTGHEN